MRKKKTTTTSFDVSLADVEKALREALPGAREAAVRSGAAKFHRALVQAGQIFAAETNTALARMDDALHQSQQTQKALNGAMSRLARLERVRKDYQRKSRELSKNVTALRVALASAEKAARTAQEDRDRIVRAVWTESERSRNNIARALPKGIGHGESEKAKH